MIRRLGSRSTQAPAGNPTSSHGSHTVAARRPTARAWARRASTATRDSATVVMPFPRPLAVSPTHSKRKSRCSSAPVGSSSQAWPYPPQSAPTRRPVPFSGAEHLAAPGGEGVERLLHLALVPVGVAHLACEQFVAVAAAGDLRSPVSDPSGRNLDGLRGELGSVGDRGGALDRYGAGGPRDRVTLPVGLLKPCLHGCLVEIVALEQVQERGCGVPPGEESGRARAVCLPTGPQLLRSRLRPAGDPGRAQRSGRSDERAKKSMPTVVDCAHTVPDRSPGTASRITSRAAPSS
jgi:hypothetical protein